MGVPKFFRWISERYPCLSELVKEYQIPEFDNLYLDMNGIIHMCSHPNDFDPHFRISEEKIFKDIFHYIEILFRMIQPKKLFFMAVDGVAPRAKMNQQRGRRFRSAKEAELLEQKARENGEELPTEERFDSNCITPGTVFMARLHEQLKYFVTYKISNDALWQKVKVILSGHETPGEGEHKIMDYIRHMKSQPDYDANTRHCLYGLDADLIMLGLCTHEPHFSLLREEVKFGRKQKRTSTPEETTFFLLHLSLMREYLELEFDGLKTSLSFPFDIEKIIDDWVLMGFLVGNDFIPPLPDMHIINGALPTLYKAYIEVLPTLGGYINEGGTLNLKRFQMYMEKLSVFDFTQFRDTYADLKYFEAKRGGRKLGAKERPSYKNKDSSSENGKTENSVDMEERTSENPELAALIKSTDDILLGVPSSGEEDDEEDCFDMDDIDYDDDESEEANALFLSEFSQHKKHYYMDKLEYSKVTSEVLRSQAECYVRAIQWNLNYYYNGVCSWSWYYPHHYAPYISDVRNFSDLKLEFEMGEPFFPFQQLLAVLPSLSKKLLPEPYQKLMVDEDSPIISYYPSSFRTDLNGKKQEWEAVVLIPFIEEKLLLEAMAPCNELLSGEEKKRNSHGPMQICTYTEENLGSYESPEYFPALPKHHARMQSIWRNQIFVEHNKLVRGLCPGVKLDVFFPGFPTLKHIPHTASVQKMKVKVFEMPSRGENMILVINDQGKRDLEEVAEELLGKAVFVEWPHLIEAKVVAVSTREKRYSLMDEAQDGSNSNSTSKFDIEDIKGNNSGLWNIQKRSIQEHYMNRLGVDIGTTNILIYASRIIGRKYAFGQSGKITLEKQWDKMSSPFALQTTVKDISVHDPGFIQFKSINDVFPPKSICFLLAHPHYGSMGEVMDSSSGPIRSGRVKVNMTVTLEPSLDEVRRKQRDMNIHYMPGSVAAQRLGISSHLVSRVTGTIYLIKGDKNECAENSLKTNVGLNLKFNKKNEEIPGYTRKENAVWYYSAKAVDLVANYMKHFPELFDYLSYHTGNDVFYEHNVFPNSAGEDKVSAISNWLKEQPFYKLERQPCGSEILEPEIVREIEKAVDLFSEANCRAKTVTMQVKPYLLYKSSLQVGSQSPDLTTTNRLFDRVVNVRESYTIPLGFKGTIIGIHKAEKEAECMYDIVFDKPFAGSLPLNCSKNRGYRVPRTAFVNLSHGQRVEQVKTVNKSTVVQPSGNTVTQDNQKYYSYTSDGRSSQQQQHLPLSNPPPPPPMSAHPNSAFASWNNQTNLRPNNGNLYGASLPVAPMIPMQTSPLYHGLSIPNPRIPMPQGPPLMPFSPSGSAMHQPQIILQQQQAQLSNQKAMPMQPQEYTFLSKTQNATPAKRSTSPTEFQALWNELQKAAGIDASNNSPVARKTKTIPSPAPSLQPPSQEVGDSGTELLKKMLRIPDEPTNLLQQPSSQLQNMKQVSVQDIFEHARAVEVKNAGHKENASYCRQLLSEFQAKGLGIPRYNYLNNHEECSMVAQVFLPDGRIATGESCTTKEQSSESAAKVALIQLGVGTIHSPNVLNNNVSHTDPKIPITNNLPTPPQQWYQQIWPQNQHQQNRFQSHQGFQQIRQSNHVSGGEHFVDWRRSSDSSGRQYNRQPAGRNMQPLQQQQQSYVPPFPVQQQHQQNWRSNWRQPVEESKQPSSQFIPLQAVKQHRSRTTSTPGTCPQPTQPKVSPNKQTNGIVRKEERSIATNIAVPHSAGPSQKKGSSAETTHPLVTTSTQKPNAPRQRKSRIAANFGNVNLPKGQ